MKMMEITDCFENISDPKHCAMTVRDIQGQSETLRDGTEITVEKFSDRKPILTTEDDVSKGDELFKRGKYLEAVEMYTRAIRLCHETAPCYAKRSACYIHLNQYKSALPDIKRSLTLDPFHEKSHRLLIQTTLYLGNVEECERAFQVICQMGLNVDVSESYEKLKWLQNQLIKVNELKVQRDYPELAKLILQCLKVCGGNDDLKLERANALQKVGKVKDAIKICKEVAQADWSNSEAFFIHAKCLFLQDNIDESIQLLKHALKLSQDYVSCQHYLQKMKRIKELRASGNNRLLNGHWKEAKKLYLDCLNLLKDADLRNDTIESKLYLNLAKISQQLNNHEKSLEYSNRAIELNGQYLKALVHRARLYANREMYEEAIRDYEAALRIDPKLPGLFREMKKTRMIAQRAQRKDYYRILNVSKNATEHEIRSAYKKQALLHHPDRHANASMEEQKEQEKLFKDLREAYGVLSDSNERSRYDQGIDIRETGMENVAEFFNMFFR